VSSTIWTPTAVSSEIARAAVELWRAVEAQHVASTRRLVDEQSEQHELEALLEDSKPPLPSEAGGLDYLLFTPFRYDTLRAGSRFRALSDPGVFYGGEQPRTACAELSFHRLRFLQDSAGLKTLTSVPHTLFLTRARGRTVDLRKRPFTRDRAAWTDPETRHYGPCQVFARVAREAQVDIIRYESVRDPEKAGCAAVLRPQALAGAGVLERQTWFLSATTTRASWIRTGERPHAASHFEFNFQ
jgi:hypothetical protein